MVQHQNWYICLIGFFVIEKCWFGCQDTLVVVYKVSKVNYIFKFKLPCQSVTCHSAWYQQHTCQLCCFTIFPSYLRVFVSPGNPWFRKSALTDNSVAVCMTDRQLYSLTTTWVHIKSNYNITNTALHSHFFYVAWGYEFQFSLPVHCTTLSLSFK